MKPSDIVGLRSKTPEELASSLLDKHFGRTACPTHILTDCRQYLTQRLLTSQNMKNVSLYQQSYYQRTPIPTADLNGKYLVYFTHIPRNRLLFKSKIKILNFWKTYSVIISGIS